MLTELNSSVAVLDIGTMKVKLSKLCSRQSSSSHSYMETRTFELAIQRASEEDFKEVISAVIDDMDKSSISGGIIIATHAARTSVELVNKLRSAFAPIGPVNVLTGEQEALLLRMTLDLARTASVGCEIGGGSVQVVDNGDLAVSVPCGTVTLSERFGLWLDDEGESRVVDYVLDTFAPFLRDKRATELTVGTGRMETFFRCLRDYGTLIGALAPHDDRRFISPDRTVKSAVLRMEEANIMLPVIRELRKPEFADVMPSDPNFMFGAHKLLIVAICLGRLLKATTICGSNKSSAQVLAERLIRDPAAPSVAGFQPFLLDSEYRDTAKS